MIRFRLLLASVLALASFPSLASASTRVSDPQRREKVIRLDQTPQMIIEGARKRLASISKVEQVTLRSGNMQYEVKGKDASGRTVVLTLDPEGGILDVEN